MDRTCGSRTRRCSHKHPRKMHEETRRRRCDGRRYLFLHGREGLRADAAAHVGPAVLTRRTRSRHVGGGGARVLHGAHWRHGGRRPRSTDVTAARVRAAAAAARHASAVERSASRQSLHLREHGGGRSDERQPAAVHSHRHSRSPRETLTAGLTARPRACQLPAATRQTPAQEEHTLPSAPPRTHAHATRTH